MNSFWFLTTSNKPRLRDPTQVQRIMAKFWFDFECDVNVERNSVGHNHLIIQGDGWPGAWLLPPDASSEDYCPDFDVSGQEEFEEFLTEIAPHLLEPLIVQAIGTATGQFPLAACEWRVEPTSATVARREFTSYAENSAPLALASV